MHGIVVSADPEIEHALRTLTSTCDDWGLHVVRSDAEAMTCLSQMPFDTVTVLVDMALPKPRASTLIRNLSSSPQALPLALACRFDVPEAVEAMKAGAVDYVPRSSEALSRLPEIARQALRENWTGRVLQEEQELDRLREDFVSVIAHELRTPLTPLKGFTQLMARAIAREDQPIDRTRFARHLRLIEVQVHRLERLASTLLENSQIRRDPRRLELARIDLNELAADAVVRCRARLGDSPQHTIHLEASEPHLLGEWDGERIDQVLTNLIENAVKYSPDGGRVVVHVWREEGYARLSVRDPGVGIPPDQQARLFKPFFRARNATSPQFDGLGLGLAISRDTVEQHGGSIWLESSGVPGAGTTAHVRLPIDLTAESVTS